MHSAWTLQNGFKTVQANFGENLKVVGSSDVLGGWDVSKSPSMTWTDGDVWCLELEIPAEEEQIHFKAGHYLTSVEPVDA